MMVYKGNESRQISQQEHAALYGNQQSAGQLLGANSAMNAKTQPPIRERIQEANKRADSIISSLGHLLSVVRPQNNNLANAAAMGMEAVRESTLSSDSDDLNRTLARITAMADQLSAAIIG